MIKATLTREADGSYTLTDTDRGETIGLGRRYPSKERQRRAMRPAIGEEVILTDATGRGVNEPGERFCVIDAGVGGGWGKVVSRHLTLEAAEAHVATRARIAVRLTGRKCNEVVRVSTAAPGAPVRL